MKVEIFYDYLLVKEIIESSTIEGTTLKIKHDDTERFMYVEVVQASAMLESVYVNMYNIAPFEAFAIAEKFQVGSKFIINRVAKTPYKDGLYFISVKDIIAKID